MMLTMEQIRDALLEHQREHEERCPGGGQPCYASRCNAIGFLAHALGVRGPNLWRDAQLYSLDYDRRCVSKDCLHESN